MHKTGVFLRAVVFTLWMCSSLIPVTSFLLLVSAVVRGEPLYRIGQGFFWASTWGARVICGITHRVQGLDQVLAMHAQGQRAVLCSKHQSTWETFALPMLLPMPLSHVFKRELLWVPFFGWAAARLDMIHIDRSKGSEAWARIAQQGVQFMAKGCWVLIFPEGTRVDRGQRSIYKNGAARLAIMTRVPIVPVAVASARVWPRGGLFAQRPGVVDVSFGPPIDPVGHTPDSLTAAVEDWIEAEMRRIDPDAYAHPAPALDVQKAVVGA